MRDLQRFCKLSEPTRIEVVDFEESFSSVLLLGSKGANKGIDLLVLKLLTDVTQIIKVFFLDDCEARFEVFLLPFFERLSDD